MWIAYDDRYLYFAFRCDDPEPARIKTSITRRDNIFSDDWVGLSLDALGTGQVAYHMMVNPSGVQMDMLQTNSGGEDQSPDWVWDSAGRVDGTGYTVEIRLPLQSIRFKGGDVARMGVLFWRRVSRTGVSVSWPQLKPNEWVFQHHAPLVFDRPARPLDARGDSERHLRGLGGARDAVGVGRATTAPAPSGCQRQVRADARRSPSTPPSTPTSARSRATRSRSRSTSASRSSSRRSGRSSWKAPGLFNLAGVGDGDGNMISAVHTRRIVDPIVGGKVTGSVGPHHVRRAHAPSIRRPAAISRPAIRSTATTRCSRVGRAQMTLPSPGSYAGALVSTTSQGPASNIVAGADVSLRKRGSSLQMTGMALYSSATAADGSHTQGLGDAVDGRHELAALRRLRPGRALRPRLPDGLGVLQPDRLHQRLGLRRAQLLSVGDRAASRSSSRVVPFVFWQGGQDRVQNGTDLPRRAGRPHPHVAAGLLPRRLRRRTRAVGRQPRYERGRWRAFGNAQFFRWLRAGGNVNAGYATYYDEVDPFQGRSRNVSAFATIQPNARLSQ